MSDSLKDKINQYLLEASPQEDINCVHFMDTFMPSGTSQEFDHAWHALRDVVYDMYSRAQGDAIVSNTPEKTKRWLHLESMFKACLKLKDYRDAKADLLQSCLRLPRLASANS